MKKTLTIVLFLALPMAGVAQTMRYFEFRVECGGMEWRDTSFIAAASDPELIEMVLDNIERPFNQRNFIVGSIDYGHGGFNRNASHWFKWHIIPNEWGLAENTVEICDGCPFTDLDDDTDYWVENVGSYCPWSSKPMREVSVLVGIDEESQQGDLLVYPNPAGGHFSIGWLGKDALSVTILNRVGQEVGSMTITKQNPTIDASALSNGLYFLKIRGGGNFATRKLLLTGNQQLTQ